MYVLADDWPIRIPNAGLSSGAPIGSALPMTERTAPPVFARAQQHNSRQGTLSLSLSSLLQQPFTTTCTELTRRAQRKQTELEAGGLVGTDGVVLGAANDSSTICSKLDYTFNSGGFAVCLSVGRSLTRLYASLGLFASSICRREEPEGAFCDCCLSRWSNEERGAAQSGS